jgi:signal transduction histidine kinase
MTRSLLVALAGSVLASVVLGLALGEDAAWGTIVLLVPIGVSSVLAGHALVGRRGALGGLRRQFAAVAVLVIAQCALVVAVFTERMFLSGHDAALTAVIVAWAALLGLWMLRLLGARALADLDAVRATLRSVALGRRDVRTGVTGSGELAELASDVDAMVARLEGEERARRALVAAVSHDLRTPVTALRLLSEAIEDGVVDGDTAREYASRIGAHVAVLGDLIDDLFELSRLESGELRWSMEEVALSELVTDAVEAMRPQAAASSVNVRALLDTGDPLAVGDRARLQRVLFNLIQNAIRHTPPDGAVTVRAEHVDGGVEIEVADTGAGIPPAERANVFEAFYRLDPARTDGGAGLGLAISRAIVEAHGGRIWVVDAAPGTRVRVRLRAAAH